MIARAGSGWQTVLADLSLILFIVTAAVVSGADGKAAAPPETSEQAEPLAFYSDEPGAPSMREWLASQGIDERQQLTITAQYAHGGLAEALRRAGQLARDAGEAGAKSRVIVEPGSGGITAVLAYDVPQPKLARDLLDNGKDKLASRDPPGQENQ